MRRIIFIIAISIICSVLPHPVFADYVLPYPSYMPGNRLYRITRIIDRLKQPFYFGNLSSYKYHLALSDKYLVEAKILFEYKQYLLAADALLRSDREFSETPRFLLAARKEGKDIKAFEVQFAESAREHTRILEDLKRILPSSFEWRPEKSDATVLTLGDMVAASIHLRDSSAVKMK